MARKMLVTGCSSGFGLAIARAAQASGWQVMGTVRKESDAAGLLEAGCEFTLLDVCDEASVQAFGGAVRTWAAEGLACLVNNAGTTYPGPAVGLTREDLRAQFEVNTIGQLAVTRELLDSLVVAQGRVIFISSISGFMATPMLGAYAASKRALEALAEAFALETGGLGVSTCVIEPGSYATAIWETSVQRGERYFEETGPFLESTRDHLRDIAQRTKAAALSQPMGDPAALARFVVAKADARRVPFYMVSPGMPRLLRFLHWLLPVRWMQAIVMSQLAKGQWRGSAAPD